MEKKQDKRIKAASESLEEMFRRIGPFMPKHPKIEQPQPQDWQVTTEGVVPWPPCGPAMEPQKRCERCSSETL